jgi:NAD-dependent dihydropyrimidine dehydrogenase PreA subunit
MHRLEIDPDKCTGCRTCVDACNVNAIGWDDSADRPTLSYPEVCQVCSVCEQACPEGALVVVPDWASRYCPPYLSTLKGGAGRRA